MEARGKESTGEVEIIVDGFLHDPLITSGSRHPVCAFTELENSETEKEHRTRSLRKLCVLMIFCFVVMLAEVVGGLKANSLAVLADAAHMLTDNINLQGAYLHIKADLIQSVGAMISGAIIWVAQNWLAVDLMISTLIFSVLVLWTTLPLVRTIFYIMMERTPPEIDADAIQDNLKHIKAVDNVRDLHVWAVTPGKVVMSCRIVAESGVGRNEVVSNIEDYCLSMYKIHHITIQVE
ncbi:hypothetical protein MLD38_017378 [Melastoma candidum]|uniref:Uncharacterized protein n=1 Tax=Melastoma candidum TaxID=119954 RepID=A0ACB9QQZ0_9MYRT|nr:hypothetical protein MLD38_017378 [Melastoma candidum]